MLSDFKKNKRQNLPGKVLFHIGGALVMGLAAFLIISNINIYKKSQEFSAQAAQLKSQIGDLKARNGSLQQGIASSDDPAYIEKVAREQLDLQKPGEKAVAFIMPDVQAQKPAAVSQGPVQGWFGWLWNWITGKK